MQPDYVERFYGAALVEDRKGAIASGALAATWMMALILYPSPITVAGMLFGFALFRMHLADFDRHRDIYRMGLR